MRTKEEILKQMEEEMPFKMIDKGQVPYIIEAMEIYAQEVVKNNAVSPLVSGSLLPLDVYKKAKELSTGEFINWWFAQKQ